jgi:formylmethanofuran dehydrogenase subunit C
VRSIGSDVRGGEVMVNQKLDNQLINMTKDLIEKCLPMTDIDYEAFKADWISKVDGRIDPFMSKFYDEMIKIIDICRKNKKETPGAATPRESR